MGCRPPLLHPQLRIRPFGCIKSAHMSLPHPADTIAAIATAPGEGAISIVRLSGPETFSLANRLFRGPSPAPSSRSAGTFVHGQIIAPDSQESLDDVLLLIFRAPHSYTGEDAVEIQCHGGSQAARRILEALLAAGARQADPGEFTKRAFLNGRIDLTQAEAVLDLIHARSERAARLATAQLEDALGIRIRSLYDDLLAISSDIESMLDFPDDELPQSITNDMVARLKSVSREIQLLLDTWQEGHVLREGAQIVIAGAPNVGKSTLLNLLAGRDRAIVSPHPGTTRDTIEEMVALQGYPLQLVDTAGLRDAPCEIEQEGIRRTHHALTRADLCICIIDASRNLSADESSFLASHKPQKLMVLLNKSDLGTVLTPDDFPGLDALQVSLLQPSFLTLIVDKIMDKIIRKTAADDHGILAISDRQKKSLLIALDDINKSVGHLESGVEAQLVIAANHARSALEPIGQIFGKNWTEDVLDTIFSRFCVGK